MTPDRTETSGLGKSSLALTVSAAATAVIGLVYWILVGRLYPPSEVGSAAAVIAAATMLAGFANLGLGSYFERFLPLSGGGRGRQAVRGMAIAAGFGLFLGTVFVFVGPTDEMFANTTQQVIFPLFVVILSGFALLDHITIGMYRAHWGAGKNITHAVAKLLCAVAASFFIGRTGIAGTWVGTALIASLVVGFFALRTARREEAPADCLPPVRERMTFTFANYGVFVVGALTPLMLPMIVIAAVGADHSAYFSIPWSLLTAVLVLLTMLTGPYVSAASDPSADIRALTVRFGGIMLAIAGTACIGLIAVGPLVLRTAGDEYATHGGPVLAVAAFALPLAAVGYAYTAVCRVRRRIRGALAIQMIVAAILLSLTVWQLPQQGLVAVSWAMVIAEGAGALLSGIALIAVFRKRAAFRKGQVPAVPEHGAVVSSSAG